MEHEAFVERVLSRLPTTPPSSFTWSAWKHDGRPTQEGFGIMPVPGVDPTTFLAAVMDIDAYVGNVDHVAVCRSIPDARYTPPSAVRFYQKVQVPMLGAVHHELVLHDMGERGGYRIAAWSLLGPETDALSSKEGFRSDYNNGCWLIADGVLGYALASAPKRGDVGRLKWAALTKGADVAATKVVKANIEGMARWAARR